MVSLGVFPGSHLWNLLFSLLLLCFEWWAKLLSLQFWIGSGYWVSFFSGLQMSPEWCWRWFFFGGFYDELVSRSPALSFDSVSLPCSVLRFLTLLLEYYIQHTIYELLVMWGGCVCVCVCWVLVAWLKSIYANSLPVSNIFISFLFQSLYPLQVTPSLQMGIIFQNPINILL